MKYHPIMWAERTTDCYAGDGCNEKRPLWKFTAEGDRGPTEDARPLILDCSKFPAGTKVHISVPVCPECEMDCEICECGFDWDAWVDDQYS